MRVTTAQRICLCNRHPRFSHACLLTEDTMSRWLNEIAFFLHLSSVLLTILLVLSVVCFGDWATPR